MKPKAITFDFWGTLFTEGEAFLEKVMPARYEILLDALSEAGHPVDEAEVREAYRQASLAFEEAWKAGEHMPVYERVARIFALLGAPTTPGSSPSPQGAWRKAPSSPPSSPSPGWRS